jgi:hypothetical protein
VDIGLLQPTGAAGGGGEENEEDSGEEGEDEAGAFQYRRLVPSPTDGAGDGEEEDEQGAGEDQHEEEDEDEEAMFDDEDEESEERIFALRERYEGRRAREASLGARTVLERNEQGEEYTGSRPLQPYEELYAAGGTVEVGACGVGSEGNLIFSTATDGWVRVYDLRSKSAVAKSYLEPSNPSDERVDIPCSGLALQLAHARFVTASFDGIVRVWDARMLRPYMRLHARNAEAISLSRCDVSHDTIAAGGSDGSIQMWDMWPERSKAFEQRS